MFNKRGLWVIFLLILLVCTVSAVSANDLNQTEITGDLATDDIISEDAVAEVSEVQKTFTDLNNDINGNEDVEIYLDCDYTFDSNTDLKFRQGITINRTLTVWGNGHTLDGNNTAGIFKVTDGDVVFHDITFTNGMSDTYGGAINGECYAIDCSFIKNSAEYDGAVDGAICINCIFSQNSARYSGGAGVGSFENCIFTGNFAQEFGGAVFNGGNMRKYSIVNCTFIENHANIGGAIYIMFSEYASVENCSFIRNSAWEAGALYSGTCVGCNFTENSAEYGGVMKYGNAYNCTFSLNHAEFGGAAYQSGCINCTFIKNDANCGGATYEGFRTINCSFIENYAYFGGAMFGDGQTAESCYFKYNYAQSGGATYQMKAKNCQFKYNEATDYGGAMYGESATNCTFKGNVAGISGNNTHNTEISKSGPSHDNNIAYFDAYASFDGDGSKDSPYKYLYADRITPGLTAYFAKGTYELNSSCIINNVRFVGTSARIVSKVPNQYDFIVNETSYFGLKSLNFINTKILNQGTLIVDAVGFTGGKVFNSNDTLGSGLFDGSSGGVIVCDAPGNIRTALVIEGGFFTDIFDAFNGGVIAAANTDIFITGTQFRQYSSTYKGGAIYCLNSKLNIRNVKFEPGTLSKDDSFIVSRYGAYTAYYGGSIYCENSEIKLQDSTFIGSVSFSFGGCIAALNSIVNSHEDYFNDSRSITDGGGAIYCSQGEVHIVNSRVYNNSAEFGGAICTLNSVLNSFRTWYVFNSANSYGGVIYDIYGSITLRTNLFGDSSASVGGTIYTRIPNFFNVYSNSFATSFAEKGSTIFFDGKRENMATSSYTGLSDNYDNLMIPLDSSGLIEFNSFIAEYSVFAEFTANLNGEEYSIISNPLYYSIGRDILWFPGNTYRVNDGRVSMMINDDGTNLSSVACGGEIRNLSAKINITEGFTNPVLKFYLIRGLNIYLYGNLGPESSNLYWGSKDQLFKGSEYELIQTYTVDLSDKIVGGNQTLTGSCSLDFTNAFLSINYNNLYEAGSFYPVSLVNISSSLSPVSGALSAYYNSNDYGFVSSVKDQKEGGNCWAFSGLATLETCLKKATGVTFDFSVENAKNLMAAYSVFGLKLETNYGGYESMLLSYLTSWLGPIDESIEDYDDLSSISIQENPMFHIQNIKFLPARLNSSDNDLYKLAIRDNGAVSVTFKWGNDYHAVSLVGWNDNYKGKDSLGNDANGAWIFKNSWGEDWENNGFGYLSYEQKISEQISPNMHAYTFVFNDINPYTKIYQYDYAGVSEFYHYKDSIYFKNNFIAEDDSLLSAFSTYFDRQTNCTVTVYVNDHFILSQEGTYEAGYYTIPFKNPVQLNKADVFSIVINNHGPGYNCIPVCSADEINKKTFNSNVSFISLDGVNWFDLYDYADCCHVACIKAFTQNVNLTSIKLNIDEFNSVNTTNFNIKLTFDDFEGINSIEYCLVKFIIDENTYYAQIKNGKSILNLNLEPGLHNLSAQYRDNVFESNIVQFKFTVTNYLDGSFNALQTIINNASGTVNLDKDYTYNPQFDNGEYGVYIGKSLTINGNGHVINGLSNATGVYVRANNVVLNNIKFVNTASSNGGALYIAGRNITLNNCSFINSSATQCGGAVYSLFDININNCRFINASANMGGGLYLINAETSHIKESCFDKNFVQTRGSAVYVEGVGTTLFDSTNFTNNNATYNGGAVLSSNYYNYFTNCMFLNNSANSGGAIFTTSRLTEFNKTVFLKNHARICAGAIMAYNSVNIFDSEFIDNAVTEKPEYFYMFGGCAGAIYSSIELNIHNSNFINNSAIENGGAIYSLKYLNVNESNFTNNSAILGGSVYNTAVAVMKTDIMGTWYYSTFSESFFYNSNFINNSADYGGALYEPYLVNKCIFINNSANSGGAIRDVTYLIESTFVNNSAGYGGAVYGADLIDNCTFLNNSASQVGGAINIAKESYSTEDSLIVNSRFINNSAKYAGAAYLRTADSRYNVWINVSSCNFTNNHAETSGGDIYSNGKFLIEKSNLKDSSAAYGGAMYLESGGTCIIRSSDFSNNSATFGGAVISFSGEESSMTNVNVTSCSFNNNSANRSGGALYLDGKSYVSDSNFNYNSAKWGSTIYALGFFDLRDSVVKSNNDTPVWFTYHHYDNVTWYGDLYLENSKIDSKYASIFYNADEKPYDLPLYLIFNNAKVVKGSYVLICHFEDESGNLFAPWEMPDLNLALTDQNNKIVKANVKYNMEFGGYYLNTSSIAYGTYVLKGMLPLNNVTSNYMVKQGSLCIMDKYGRTTPAIISKGLTKVYGKGDKLVITLKDSNKKPIANAYINVFLNGKEVKIKTDSKGKASLAVNFAPGKYTAYLSVSTTSAYLSTFTTTKVTIKKIASKIVSSKKTFKADSKKKVYSIKLKDKYGKAINNAKVTIKIKKKTYKAKTNSKGKATFKLKLNKKGKYKATVKYVGNAYYKAAAKKVKITIKN